MIVYDKKMLDNYMKNDWILKLLLEEENQRDVTVRTHQWLKSMENKRLIYADVYGDLLEESSERMSVLDIGGGYTSLTKRMVRSHNYKLVDFIAHGGEETIVETENECNKKFWINKDWNDFEVSPNEYDLIIANDIFPDVDQRLELFIEKYLPYCKELRLVVTFYNEPKYYRAKRVDDAEMLTFLSWDGEITGIKLMKYMDKIIDTEKEEIQNLCKVKDSIYWNGRQVAVVRLKGGR